MFLQAGELIARLDLDDPSSVRKAEPFHGNFPVLGPPTAISGRVHQRCAASLNAARMILAGYEHNIDEVSISLSHSNLFTGIKYAGNQKIFSTLVFSFVKLSALN